MLRVVDKRGVSNAVGSGRTCALNMLVVPSRSKLTTHDSKTPKEAERGRRPRGNGKVSLASHVVCCISSLYVARGRRAVVSYYVTSCQLTVPQSRHDSQNGRIVGIPVKVDAHDVDVDGPGCLPWGDDQGRWGQCPRTDVSLPLGRSCSRNDQVVQPVGHGLRLVCWWPWLELWRAQRGEVNVWDWC